jgi:Protein of unknown function (DUF2877)
VFARACYVDCGTTLLTLGAATIADGPTTLVLGSDGPPDLRGWFRRGDPFCCRTGRLRSPGATLDLGRARTWRAPDARPPLARRERMHRRDWAWQRLALARRTRASVLAGAGNATIAGLVQACGRFEVEAALGHAARLVGWGEGLTPAGDDFLVGLSAALHALCGTDGRRRAFVARMEGFFATQRSRTTPIAAHALALAAQGHFNGEVHRALDAVIAVGATSGADTLHGLLAGLSAWPERDPATGALAEGPR